MACRFRRELPEAADRVEGSIKSELRRHGGEVEAVLLLYCRSCDCVHVSLIRRGHANQALSDSQALEALGEAAEMLFRSIQAGEESNVEKETPSVQPVADRKTLN